MTNKAQLKHLLLDVEFNHKPKIVDLRGRFTWLANLWLIETYAQMSRSSDGCVTRYTLVAIAEMMKLDKVDEIIKHCVKENMISLDGDKYFNERVLKDQQSLYDKRNQTKERVTKYRESNKDVTRYKESNNSVTDTVTVCVTSDTDTVYEYINNNNKIEKENIPDSNEEETPVQKMVKLALDEPNDQPWTRTNAYMLSGRRPMKKYPNIFLTPYEMEMVFNKYEPYTPEFRIMCFTQCEEKLRQKVENGERLMSLPAFTWLTTFIYQSALESLTKETRLKNQQSYAKVHP